MINYLIASLLFVLSFSAYSQHQEIIGTWKGEDHGQLGQFIFDKEGFVYLTLDNETVGGPSYEFQGVKASATYKLDPSHSPIWIDFVLTFESDGSEIDWMSGIVDFSDDFTEMQISLDLEGKGRPESFIKDESILLQKVD